MRRNHYSNLRTTQLPLRDIKDFLQGPLHTTCPPRGPLAVCLRPSSASAARSRPALLGPRRQVLGAQEINIFCSKGIANSTKGTAARKPDRAPVLKIMSFLLQIYCELFRLTYLVTVRPGSVLAASQPPVCPASTWRRLDRWRRTLEPQNALCQCPRPVSKHRKQRESSKQKKKTLAQCTMCTFIAKHR